MNTFVTITANLSKDQNEMYEVVSGSKYTLSGVVSSNSHFLSLDDKSIPIAPFTYTWVEEKTAPITGANTKITHIVTAVGTDGNPHNISSASNAITILVLPACN